MFSSQHTPQMTGTPDPGWSSTPAPGSEAEPTAHVIMLDSVETPWPTDDLERMDWVRHLSPLMFVDSDPVHMGGMGKALHAYNCFGESLCLKCLNPVERHRHDRKKAFAVRAMAFRDEYECQVALHGVRGLPEAFGYGSYAGGPLLLMEWVNGIGLNAVRNEIHASWGRVPGRICAALGAAVFGVLLDARGIDDKFVHRDISPKNILIRNGDMSVDEQIQRNYFDVCLIDLGSALHTGAIDLREDGESPRIWRNATPEYAPPEMLAPSATASIAQRQSPLIDVYAMCSVLYELYAGSTPYELSSVDPQAFHTTKLCAAPAPLVARNPKDEPFVRAVMSGLSRTQSGRPSIGEMRAMMLQASRR